jgi:hypothetical protein
MRQLKTVTVAVAGARIHSCVCGCARTHRHCIGYGFRMTSGHPRVSGQSPFQADCNGAAFPISAAYLNAEVEPYVAINPRDQTT